MLPWPVPEINIVTTTSIFGWSRHIPEDRAISRSLALGTLRGQALWCVACTDTGEIAMHCSHDTESVNGIPAAHGAVPWSPVHRHVLRPGSSAPGCTAEPEDEVSPRLLSGVMRLKNPPCRRSRAIDRNQFGAGPFLATTAGRRPHPSMPTSATWLINKCHHPSKTNVKKFRIRANGPASRAKRASVALLPPINTKQSPLLAEVKALVRLSFARIFPEVQESTGKAQLLRISCRYCATSPFDGLTFATENITILKYLGRLLMCI